LITEIENSIYLPGGITGYQRNPCNGFAFDTGKGGGGVFLYTSCHTTVVGWLRVGY